jgi:hypothetical protein
MDQHLIEALLISIVVALTLVAYVLIRRSEGSPAKKSERLLTGLLGGFMILGGSAKFFEPFATMFGKQIALSQLPFPMLSVLAGQAGEIASGLVLLAFFVFSEKFAGALGDKIFYLTNLLIVIIMLVAVYVHLHPDVPAEVLPFQSKPPVLTIIVMLLALLNAFLRWRNQRDA